MMNVLSHVAVYKNEKGNACKNYKSSSFSL